MSDDNMLRVLVDLRDMTVQKNRIAFSNRITAVQDGRDNWKVLTSK
jgi:hypothetical protein